MKDKVKDFFEEATPNPEYLIKSIAEQGYSMKTSIADLIDNSISASATRMEILVDTKQEPFTLFLADDGDGMDESTLSRNMKFPSQSIEIDRAKNDLGRFGLGMKTASFSQTRKFTVLSRRKDTIKYCGRTWDVASLRKNGWRIIINSEDEIDEILSHYHRLTYEFLNSFKNYKPNTLIIWHGLYKFDQNLDQEKRSAAIRNELTGIISDHLSMVFHRFLERKEVPIKIRINNRILEGFNPFPEHIKDFRALNYKQSLIKNDLLKIEGFILPSRSLNEAKQGESSWTQKGKSLSDMEGVYVYRSDRLIIIGGWNDIISKSQRLQLARLRVEVGNAIDHLLQLDVSKSKIVIPYNLRTAFNDYTMELKEQATAEYRNKLVAQFPSPGEKKASSLFEKRPSNRGMRVEINTEFSILKELSESLDHKQRKDLRILIRMVNNTLNAIKKVHEDHAFTGFVEDDGISHEEFEELVIRLKIAGMTEEDFLADILPSLGFSIESIPDAIMNLIKKDV